MWTICSLSDGGYDPVNVSLNTEAAMLPPGHLCCFLSRKFARALVPQAVFTIPVSPWGRPGSFLLFGMKFLVSNSFIKTQTHLRTCIQPSILGRTDQENSDK